MIASAAQHPSRTRVLIVGDSLAIGAAEVQGLETTRRIPLAYPELMQARLPDAEIIVEADVQRNSTTVCSRLEQWLVTHRPAIVLAAIGGSDADCDWRRFILSDGRTYRSRTSLEAYIANLRRIAAMVDHAGASLLMTEPSNQDVSMRGIHLSALSGRDVTAMIAAVGGQPACNERLCTYRQAVAEVASQTGATLLPCAVDWGTADARTVLCEDGAHLNQHAHHLLADSYVPAIRQAVDTLAARSLRSPA